MLREVIGSEGFLYSHIQKIKIFIFLTGKISEM